MRLPLIMAEDVVQQQPHESKRKLSPETQSAMTSGETSERKPTLLSVDDDIVNQTIIQAALGSDFDVEIAMDGFAALEYLKNKPLPDVMLLDVMMPGISGFEVCRSVRQEMGIDPTVLPILMLSASVLKARIRSTLQITKAMKDRARNRAS